MQGQTLPNVDGPSEIMVVLITSLVFVIPAIGLSTTLFMALWKRVQNKRSWWIALISSWMIPMAIITGLELVGWTKDIRTGQVIFLWMTMLIIQIAYVMSWWLMRWRPDPSTTAPPNDG